MSANIMSSLAEDNKALRKQMGCMKGIFQIFDRHHFIIGRRISSHSHKRLLPAGQHQLEPKSSTKAPTEKELKEKPRISMESSRPSNSSSCSSTFSSFDSNRTAKQINIPETPFHLKAQKKQKPSLTQSHDLRDVVKDSMYREPRSLSIKSLSSDERRVPAMKHIDSPRPLLHSKSGKSKESARVLANKVHEGSRISLARFSYDGRESREMYKSSAKELPRLSLDSKVMKSSAVESRLNFLGRDQEPARPSSVVAKLMGLEPFPDNISSSTEEMRFSRINPFPEKTEKSKQNLVTTNSPRLQKSNSLTKPITRPKVPTEPAPWKQQQDPQSKKAPKDTPRLSSSVYGEMEKRITQLEFNKSGKDLRALKQILEAMKKSREHLESQAGESAEFIEDHKSLMLKKKASTEEMPALMRPGPPKPLKVMRKGEISISAGVSGAGPHLQRLQTRERIYQRENSAHRQEAQDFTPRNNNCNRASRGFQQVKAENCTTSGRNFEMVSPRLRKNATPSSDFGGVKKNFRKKLEGTCSENRKQRVKTNLQLSDDQLSELSSETRYSSNQGDSASIKSESNNSQASQMETEVIRLFNSTNTNGGKRQNSVSTTREHMLGVELAVNVLEQPSPVSVLDATFYIEDSPSPVKKISTAFREEDGSPIPDEAEWHIENLNHLMDCKTSGHGIKYNQKLENMNLIGELRLLNNEPDETAGNNKVDHIRDHRYIDKMLQTSGLLKAANFISKANQNFSSSHLINPDMFHVLEQTESIIEGVNGKLTGKDDWRKLNQKSQRKIVFDMVNEILVCKITSAGLFTLGRKKMSSQGLLKEIYLEIDRLHGMPCYNLDEEDDGMVKLLAADLMYQSEDWADYGVEIPALVLDIERQIFKDLINEVVTGALMSVDLNDMTKRHCRQLFTK